jgi:hypothetical protein
MVASFVAADRGDTYYQWFDPAILEDHFGARNRLELEYDVHGVDGNPKWCRQFPVACAGCNDRSREVWRGKYHTSLGTRYECRFSRWRGVIDHLVPAESGIASGEQVCIHRFGACDSGWLLSYDAKILNRFVPTGTIRQDMWA